MNSKILLRIAAIVMFFHAVGHSMGTFAWQTMGGIPSEVVAKMYQDQFNFMGKASTMASLFTGNGVGGLISLLLMSALLWAVSGWNNKNAVTVLWCVGCAIVALAVCEIIYFFPMAYAFCLIAAALVFTSIFLINKSYRLMDMS
jgi:hypothetical protein